MKVLGSGSLDPNVLRAIQAIASLAGFVVCTSSTRPLSPETGQGIYETDTKVARFWDGSAWVAPVAVWA